VRADAVRLRQLLLNLLTNADRHTAPDGSITVRSRGQDGEAVVEVHNTGASLDDEQLARVFDRFWRADPSRQRATGGSGLGLAIVKHLVEAQGGRVWAARDVAGLTFGFALPGGPGGPGQGTRERVGPERCEPE
jgi:two-component system sensor histidine kinase BaeS